MHDIATWFLVLSLIFPRLTLFIAWCSGGIPPNTIPFFAEVLMTLFVPRVLVLIYIATTMGMHEWFWIHLVVMVLVWSGSIFSRSSK
jgi:hypothetical protein